MRAVLFDLFDTLVSDLGYHLQRPGPSAAARLGADEDAFRALWRAQLHARNTGASPDYRAALRQACATLQLEPDPSAIEAIYTERVTAHAAIVTNIEPVVLRMLAALRERGVPLGLVSNCDPTEVMAWAESPLATYFPAPVFSWEVGYAKPEREIYQLALSRLGLAPADALFVGDGGSDELAGAARAGLTPYQARWFLDRWVVPERARAPALSRAPRPRPRSSLCSKDCPRAGAPKVRPPARPWRRSPALSSSTPTSNRYSRSSPGARKGSVPVSRARARPHMGQLCGSNAVR